MGKLKKIFDDILNYIENSEEVGKLAFDDLMYKFAPDCTEKEKELLSKTMDRYIEGLMFYHISPKSLVEVCTRKHEHLIGDNDGIKEYLCGIVDNVSIDEEDKEYFKSWINEKIDSYEWV